MYHHYDPSPCDDVEAVEAARLDADLEMAEMDRVGDAVAAAERAGVCHHSSAVRYRSPVAYDDQIGLRPGQLRCRYCQQVFASDQDWLQAMDEVLTTRM